ncbi:MAG: RNA-guided endonuclease InsQ/TnpB family protein, partial [Xenococcaceae cyanobacterium]
MYRTIPIRAKFTDSEIDFWADQCRRANSLTNCAVFYVRQKHYDRLSDMENSLFTYWSNDDYRAAWKTYRCLVTYSELCRELKSNPHYKILASQSAQQTLKTVAESISAYNKLVGLYYEREVDKPSLPRYRKKGGLAAITFPRQALNYCEGYFKPSISREIKSEVIADIRLELPEFIAPDWVKEVTIRPSYGQFWLDWVIDDGQEPIEINPNLDYTQALGLDHGGVNWLTGVSTKGESFIIDGKKLRALNQGYCRLMAKYKQGKPNKYWDGHLDRLQLKRNNQMRDIVNKAARFIVNRCLHDQIGNLVFGWNFEQKIESNMGKRNNQNFVTIPTGRLILRLKQLCGEFGIKFTVTEEAYTSQASCLDGDSLPKYGEKPDGWSSSGQRVKRGLYKTAKGFLINADCNGAVNILRKVAKQLGISLVEVGRGALT